MVIRSRKARPVCEACGGGVWSKGYRSVVLVDLPAFGRPVRLCWRKRRWTCRERRRVVPITTGGVARRDPLGCVGHVGPVSNGPMTGVWRVRGGLVMGEAADLGFCGVGYRLGRDL